MHFFALSVTTSLKIPGAVIPRRVFTRPGPKTELMHCNMIEEFGAAIVHSPKDGESRLAAVSLKSDQVEGILTAS